MPKSGFVAIVGRCNVGKSTLLNAILNHKVSIVSDIPQTTRYKIKGIYSDSRGQIIFVDTPGINLIRFPLTKRFNNVAFETLSEVDVILYVVDIHDKIGREERVILEYLRTLNKPVVLALNKKDKGKGFVNDYICEAKDIAKYFVPISAINSDGIAELLDTIYDLLPACDKLYYPIHMKSDFPLKLFVTEIIREKFLHLLREELPYYMAILIEELVERPNGVIYIRAMVVTREERHKAMIIGKEGSLIKLAGTEARKELESLFGKKVILDLWVKVNKNWINDAEFMQELGYAM